MADYRITFSKKGPLSFISHLDFNHSFIRILKRAGLPLKYSQGFNPRPKIVFGLPLSVGMEGENEIVDISLTEEISCDEIKNKLSEAVPNDLVIKSVNVPDKKIKYIELAEYSVEFYDYIADTDKICEVLTNPPQVIKRTKSGEKLTDIKDMIKQYNAGIRDGTTIINLTLTAFDSNYLNPEYVVASLNNAGLNLPDDYKIVRQKIIFKN